ncbi:MAG: SufS family cysteine desulfurase [Weeksellaceae bacterium]|nr:SufS family cysteine desulfurase [Weeksellaceae bacterium]
MQSIRSQFPILDATVNGKPLIYLDNGATTQKPQVVIDAIQQYYSMLNANVHRGIHTLSQEATTAMENSRLAVRNFIGAKETHEIIFTYGTTDAINMVAHGLTSHIHEGDEILITELEHHANIVPWQMLCERTKAVLKYIPLNSEADLALDQLEGLLSHKTRIVAFNHVSNALGIVNPVQEIIQKVREKTQALILIDGAQAAAHIPLNMQELGVDFYVFSAHKMYGPTGVGILYGREEVLKHLYPMRGGGEMIDTVTMQHSTYAGLPFLLEAGTPNIAGNIALGTAIAFIENIGVSEIGEYEDKLTEYALQKISELDELEIYAPQSKRSGAISFNMRQKDVHPSDVGMILDRMGIAVRTGHHCCQPIMHRLGIKGTVRASFAIYNTLEEVDQLQEGLKKAINMLAQ